MFAEMGENVIYRSLLMRHHGKGAWARLHPAWRGLLIAVTLYFGSFLLAGLLPLLVIMALFARNRTGTLAACLRLPESLEADLVDLPIAPRDWTDALWAFATTPKGRSAAPFAVLFYLVGSAVMLTGLAFAVDEVPAEGIATVAALLGIAAGTGAKLARPPAEAYLPGLTSRMKQLRRILLRRGRPIAMLLAALLTIVLVFVAIMVVTFGLTLLISGVLNSPGIGSAVSGLTGAVIRWMGMPAAPYANFLIGAMISAGLVALHRRNVVRRRETYLNRIDTEIQRILDDARARRDAPGGDAKPAPKAPRGKGRSGSRPASAAGAGL